MKSQWQKESAYTDIHRFGVFPENNWICWFLRLRPRTTLLTGFLNFNFSAKKIAFCIGNFSVLECVLLKHWFRSLKRNSWFHLRVQTYLKFSHNVMKVCITSSLTPWHIATAKFAFCFSLSLLLLVLHESLL